MTRNKMLEEARAATPRMTGRPPPLLAALFLLGGILWCRAACAGEETTRVPLDPALARIVTEAITRPGDPRASAPAIWDASIERHGSIDPLLGELQSRIASSPEGDARRLSAIRLAARLLRRLGDLSPALEMLERIPAGAATVTDRLSEAEILDALGRNEQALEAYAGLLGSPLEPSLRNRILLRRALMGRRGAGARADEGPSPLALFAAEEGRDPELRDQAAIVLALLDGQKEAIDLFTPEGEGTERFRQDVRLAEWALEAEEWRRAQEFAWSACRAAALGRDRRYALTVLVEAYRRGDALGRLIERFAGEPQLDDDSRQVWIDLLRETGRAEDALRLFRGAAEGEFTVEMRRELLEICRETGEMDLLVDAYHDLIEAEPRFIEWREGLSRFHLERGERQRAQAVWRTYLEVTGDTRYRMAAAATLRDLGLDDLAAELARACMGTDEGRDAALLFLFELHLGRGSLEKAERALAELDRLAGAGAAVRQELAEGYERLGDRNEAVRVLDGLRQTRGAEVSPDTEMKLALLLSEVGDEDKALELWRSLWRRTESIPRRRYVEERLMTVASRLGKLARIAVDLERKLAEGSADDREAGLLVRLYTRVKDPVSATEVIEEHMGSAGRKPVEVLNEKARVFLSCEDYYSYEQVIGELIEADPEGRPDYLRQLAMSKLEQGRRDEARRILERLKDEAADSASLEFEAGVLALAGMREEAIRAYRRSLTKHPERIDTHLLLSNVMKELGRHQRSAGMFQHLAATADRDDLFTIAIDGILNMRDGRANRGAPDRLVEWARRVTLERLARRPDRLYLYRLVADLSDELKDKETAIRALKAALPVAGEQRTQLLRELMAMAKASSGLPAGVIIIGAPARARENERNTEELMFGRRLLGQRELVPPQVYLELGEAFLAAGEVGNATRTFQQASRLPEFAEMQRPIARAFELARYPKEALRVYERIFTVEGSDVGLITKVGELQEQLGRDEIAQGLYRRGLELLLARRPFSTTPLRQDEDQEEEEPSSLYRARNIDELESHYEWLLAGFLATAPGVEELERAIAKQREGIDADLARIAAGEIEEAEDGAHLEHYPRLQSRISFLRRLATAASRIDVANALDRRLLEAFPRDEKLLEEMCRFRIEWGYLVSARRLIEESARPDEEKRRLRLLAGGGAGEATGVIPIGEAAGLLLPLLVGGAEGNVKALLERLDLSTGDKTDLEQMPVLLAAAVCLGESELALGLCRHWLNLLVEHSSGTLYAPVEGLLERSRMVLGGAQQRSLMEHLVSAVVEDPDRFATFIQRLPDLQKTVGSELMTTEQVESLIESRLDASDRFIHGIPELFTLIPAEDRPSALRAAWPKVPRSQRTLFLLQLLPRLDAPAEPSFAEFLCASFEESLEDLDDRRMVTFYVDRLAEGSRSSLPVALRFIEILRESDGEEPLYQAAYALALKKDGRLEEAYAEAREAFASLAALSKSEYRVTAAVRGIIDAFHADHREDLLRVIDEVEERDGAGADLAKRRLDLIERAENPAALHAALDEAVKAHPKDVELSQRLRRHLDRRGFRFEALKVQEEIVEREPKKAAHRRRLIQDWRRLRNPVAALRVKEGERARLSGMARERTPPATIVRVRKFLEDGDAAAARTTYRRLWRVFPDRTNRYFRWQYDHESNRRRFWPRDPDENEARARGGIPELTGEDEEKKRLPRPALEVLGEQDFGIGEIERRLRSMSPGQLAGEVAGDAYRALAARAVGSPGREAAIAGLRQAEREGRAGKRDYGLLFALLEAAAEEEAAAEMEAEAEKEAAAEKETGAEAGGAASAEERATPGEGDGSAEDAGGRLPSSTPAPSAQETDPGIGDALGALLKNIDPTDTAQLRRMARLHAHSGRAREAAVLYRWCAAIGEDEGFNYYASASELLKEVIEVLDGKERDEAVEAVLAFGDPGEDSPWGRDAYERLILETWERLLGPQAALEKTRVLCEGVTELGSMPRRRTAMRAASLLARAGEVERAVECLEVGLCKFDPPDGLRYPWYRHTFESPGRIAVRDMGRLFPERHRRWVAWDEWLRQAAARIGAWLDADRLDEESAFQLLSVIGARLHAAGRGEEAGQIFARVSELAEGNAGRLLWVADLARALGEAPRGDAIERRLLGKRRLDVERVPEVIARVLEREGPEAALALGEPAAEVTLHPDLLDLLTAAARALGDDDRARRWATTKAGAQSAKEALEEE